MELSRHLMQMPVLWFIFSPQIIIPTFFLIYFGILYQFWRVRERRSTFFEFYGGNFEQLSENKKREVLKMRAQEKTIFSELRKAQINSLLMERNLISENKTEMDTGNRQLSDDQKALDLIFSHQQALHPELYKSLSKQIETKELTK